MKAITFLDVEISKSEPDAHGWCRFRWQPSFKPTALKSVLSPRSAHPSSVHYSWLVGYFRRLHSNSWDSETYWSAKRHAMQLLRTSSYCKPALRALDLATRFSMQIRPFGDCQAQSVSTPVISAKKIWVTFDFHPHLKGIVDRARRFFNRHASAQAAFHAIFQQRFCVEISWRLSSVSLLLRVR